MSRNSDFKNIEIFTLYNILYLVKIYNMSYSFKIYFFYYNKTSKVGTYEHRCAHGVSGMSG